MARSKSQRSDTVDNPSPSATRTSTISPFALLSNKTISLIGEMTRDEDDAMDTLSLAATDRRMRNAISDAAVRIFMLKIKKSRFENEMEFAKLIAGGKKDKMRHLVLWTRLRTSIQSEGRRLADRLISSCPALRTITYRPSSQERPITLILNAFNPATSDIEDLGMALKQLRWGWANSINRWGETGAPISFKVLSNPDDHLEPDVPAPCAPSTHFGLYNARFIPNNYFLPPKAYPVKHIQQIATAISMSPKHDAKRLFIENFVGWSEEGRTCTVDMLRTVVPCLNFNLSIKVLVEAGDADPTLDAGQDFARSIGAVCLQACNVGSAHVPTVSVRIGREGRTYGRNLDIAINSSAPGCAQAHITLRECGVPIRTILNLQ